MTSSRLSGIMRGLGAVATAFLVAACGQELTDVPSGPNFAGDGTIGATIGLCKVGPEGTTATFEISATGGELLHGSTVTLEALPGAADDPTNCKRIWGATTTDVVAVTITEVAFTGNVELDTIRWITDLDGAGGAGPEPPSVTVHGDFENGGIVGFKNVEVPGDDGGGAGCTPGFWRQPHHFEFWTAPYTPSTAFGDVFANAFPGHTLHDVVQLGGGGLNALGRHTVAALLNAASPDVDYGTTPAGVIADFNAAFASGEYEDQKDIFEGLNEQGCTAKDDEDE